MTDQEKPTRERVIEQVDAIQDGRLDEVERRKLEEWLSGDPSARAVYIQRLQLHGMLRSEMADIPASISHDDVESSPALPQNSLPADHLDRPRRRVSVWWLAAAAAVLLIAWGGFPSRFGLNRPIATLEQSEHCRWTSSTLPTATGSRLQSGSMSLVEGVARIRFRSGATVDLEGPAQLQLVTPMRCRLISGSLTADVPPSAQGFVVDTPSGRVVDFGTQFGVTTDGQASDVQVFEGHVELQRPGVSAVTLRTGQGASMRDREIQVDSRQSPPPEVAMRSAEARLAPEETRVSTALGRGATKTVFSPGTSKHFSETLVLLKSTSTDGFRRKGYLRFDLSQAADSPHTSEDIAEASLTLCFTPSGYGYASRSPNAHFSVYGLTDQSLDDWDTQTIDWESSPGNVVEGNQVDPGVTRQLASFTIARDETAGVRKLQSPELTEFLRSDSNGLVTLILVRDTMTGPNDPYGGLVHAIAGNAHPTIAPPSLTLRFQPPSRPDSEQGRRFSTE